MYTYIYSPNMLTNTNTNRYISYIYIWICTVHYGSACMLARKTFTCLQFLIVVNIFYYCESLPPFYNFFFIIWYVNIFLSIFNPFHSFKQFSVWTFFRIISLRNKSFFFCTRDNRGNNPDIKWWKYIYAYRFSASK